MLIDKQNYYLDIACAVSRRAPCLKKQYGAVIVNNDRICSTGYNGPPSKEPHCTQCTKGSTDHDINEYSCCPSVHAEMNAIIMASKEEMLGADLYLAGFDVKTNAFIAAEPCQICLRLIKNAGINRVYNKNGLIYERKSGVLIKCH